MSLQGTVTQRQGPCTPALRKPKLISYVIGIADLAPRPSNVFGIDIKKATVGATSFEDAVRIIVKAHPGSAFVGLMIGCKNDSALRFFDEEQIDRIMEWATDA